MMNHQQLLQLGILLVFIGMIVIFASLAATPSKEKEKSNFKFSVVGFLGFIPFGFGNDKRLLLITAVLTVVVVAAAVILSARNAQP